MASGLYSGGDMKQKRIQITFGGSHRQNQKCMRALGAFIDGPTLPATLGSKRLRAIVFDTPEMREVLQRLGGSVARRQPSWLNEGEKINT